MCCWGAGSNVLPLAAIKWYIIMAEHIPVEMLHQMLDQMLDSGQRLSSDLAHSFSNSLILELTHPGEHDVQLAHCSWLTVTLARSPAPGNQLQLNQAACLSLATCCYCCLSQAPRALAAPGCPHLPGHRAAVPPGPAAPALGKRAGTGHQQGPPCLLERSGGADHLCHEAHHAAHEDQTLHCISGV